MQLKIVKKIILNKAMKKRALSLLSTVTVLSMVLGAVLGVQQAFAASLTNISDTLTTEVASTAADHTILFTTPTGVANAETITLTFQSDFDVSAVVAADVAISGSTFGAMTVAADCSATDEASVGVAGQVITLTLCTGDGGLFVATETVTIAITNLHITNPTSAGSYTLTIGGTMTDSGVGAISIVDSDVVTISATVDPSITFDLDTGAALAANTAATYSVALGTLTSGSVTTSGVSSVNYIGMDLDTNASGGAVITVASDNATGLCSTSVTGDCIPYATTVAAGTAGFGICVGQITAATEGVLATSAFSASGTLQTTTTAAEVSPSCTTTSHALGTALTNATQTIINTNNNPVAGGRVEVLVKAGISGVTPAHNDYTNTLTFIATGTF